MYSHFILNSLQQKSLPKSLFEKDFTLNKLEFLACTEE